jgi:hypothetical protein
MMLLAWSFRPIPPVLLKIQQVSPGPSLLELRIWHFLSQALRIFIRTFVKNVEILVTRRDHTVSTCA